MMKDKELSKFLSYVLRHAPETIGIKLDDHGWVNVDELIGRAKKAGKVFDLATLQEVVATNDKQRFTLSEAAADLRIRAAQGHSVTVDLALEPVEPPTVLFHGTAARTLDAIFATGLQPGRRQKVHLSTDEATAIAVGTRHGRPTVLRVAAGEMHAAGHAFWRADNGVWLVDEVPARFLGFGSTATR